MPTSNPRVNVTLSPSLDALVARMAGLTRVSKSQVLRELLETAEPSLQRAVALMEAAANASRSVHTELASGLGRAQADAERAIGPILAQMDLVTADLVSQAEAIKGKRPGRNPLASNRGVKTTGTGRKSKKTTPRSRGRAV